MFNTLSSPPPPPSHPALPFLSLLILASPSSYHIIITVFFLFCCSATQSCLTLFDLMGCSTPSYSVLHYLPEFAQTHVHWVSDAIQPSHPLAPFSSCPQSFPTSRSFPLSQLFTSGGQSIEASASASVLPISSQGWFPLGLTGLISLQSQRTLKSLIQNHNSKAPILQCSAFFMAQLSHRYMTTGKTIALTIWTVVVQ